LNGVGDVVDPLLDSDLPVAGLPALPSVGDILPGAGSLTNAGSTSSPLTDILDPVLDAVGDVVDPLLNGVGDVVDPLLDSDLPVAGLPALPSVGDILPGVEGFPSAGSTSNPLPNILGSVLSGAGDVVDSVPSGVPGTNTVHTTPIISNPGIDLGVGGDVGVSGAVTLPGATGPLIDLDTGASAGAGVGATVPSVDIPAVLGPIIPEIYPHYGFPINPTAELPVLPSLPPPPVVLPSPPVATPTVPLRPISPIANIFDDLRQILIAKLSEGQRTRHEYTYKLLLAILSNDRAGILQTLNHYFADSNSLLSAENTLLLDWKRPASKIAPKPV
jgi:hypothetical protein